MASEMNNAIVEKEASENSDIELFDCPVCRSYMVPPIFQCERGHNICSDCNFKVARCPVCRGRKGGRNTRMEVLCQRLQFPCPNATDGCEFVGNAYATKFHELGCQFNFRRCPMFSIRLCSWSGYTKNMLEHFTENHPRNVYVHTSVMVTIQNMCGQTTHQGTFIMSAYDTVFPFFWSYNHLRRELKFALTHYGVPTTNAKFCYMVGILGGDDDWEAVKISAPCYCIRGDEGQPFAKNQYMTLPFGTIQGFLSSRGSLRFVVKILDNNLFMA